MTILTEPAGDAAVVRPMLRTEDIPLIRRLAAFAFLMLAEFFYGWAWNSVDVLRPAIRESLDLSLTQAGSGYSAQGAGALIGAVIVGQMADRFGRRNMLAVIMAGYGASLIAGVLVTSYVGFLAERFVLGLFMGGIFPVVVGVYVSLFNSQVRGRLASCVNAIFSGSIVALGIALGALGNGDWRTLLLLGGIPPILLAGVALVLIPDQRRYLPFGATGTVLATPKLPVAHLFEPSLRSRTILLALLAGLNFFAYQAFSGWATVYLKEVRLMPATVIGSMVAWQFVGNIAGGFAWGWVGDRFGRKANLLGFLLAAAAITTFMFAPSSPALVLQLIGALYGFGLSASVIWGPWMAELYPVHLRSTAASIFNWGRLISFFAPLVTGPVAETFGLTVAMLMSAVVFVVAAGIWASLPETLPKRARTKRSMIERRHVGPRMSQSVKAAGLVFLAGQVAQGDTVADQTRTILGQIDALLAEAGTDKQNLLSASIWLTDIAKIGEMNAVWDAWVEPGHTPARATVEAKLAAPHYLVEIAVVAAA